MQIHGVSMRTVVRKIAIAVFVFSFAVAIAIDTFPEAWAVRFPIRRHVHHVLTCLGLQQGDWPLFAPNPRISDGLLVGEIQDANGNNGIWTSSDWSKVSAFEKFYRFRHLNYSQRVGRNFDASNDLADYLQRSIPDREGAIPGIRWTEDNEPVISSPIAPPIRQISLYHRLRQFHIAPDEPLPAKSEIVWIQRSTFLVRRDYKP